MYNVLWIVQYSFGILHAGSCICRRCFLHVCAWAWIFFLFAVGRRREGGGKARIAARLVAICAVALLRKGRNGGVAGEHGNAAFASPQNVEREGKQRVFTPRSSPFTSVSCRIFPQIMKEKRNHGYQRTHSLFENERRIKATYLSIAPQPSWDSEDPPEQTTDQIK